MRLGRGMFGLRRLRPYFTCAGVEQHRRSTGLGTLDLSPSGCLVRPAPFGTGSARQGHVRCRRRLQTAGPGRLRREEFGLLCHRRTTRSQAVLAMLAAMRLATLTGEAPRLHLSSPYKPCQPRPWSPSVGALCLGVSMAGFKIVRAQYNCETGRAYAELRNGDDDGGDAVAVAIFSYKRGQPIPKKELEEDLLRKARYSLKGAAVAT